MRAIVIDQFGGPEELKLRDIQIPSIEDDEVLIKVAYAGIGQWDIFEREGGYSEMLGLHTKFPYILGSEGSGIILAKGKNVEHFSEGNKVYATGFLNPKGGFYAEFAAIKSKYVMPIPPSLTIPEASVISGAGITALRGLEDVLNLKTDETIMILGASGGVGHLAVQIAQHTGARVFAIASGADGVALMHTLQVDMAVDGRSDDVLSAARAFAPDGFDKALFTAGGDITSSLIQCLADGGKVAYPNGVFPIVNTRSDIYVSGYNGDPTPEIIERLYNQVHAGEIKVHIDQMFSFKDAYQAHLALEKHYPGKLCFQVND